jgi:peroxiredoxin Q/BCP
MAAKKKPAKKPAAKTSAKPAKKPAPKAAAVKKAAVKKSAPKKAAPKKAPVKARAPKKAAVVKIPAPKAAAAPRKAAPARTAAKKASPAPGSAAVVVAEAPRAEVAPVVAVIAAPAPAAPPQMITTSDGGHAVAPKPAAEPVDAGVPEGMPKPGDLAPEFSLKGDDDQRVTLSGLRGKKVILYFYPRDNTPGCTLEAREFSSLLPEFQAKNAIVLGVSTDTVEAHRKFKHTCELEVRLLADPEKTAHNAFGTWREKNMYGKKVLGTQRSTFVIDEDGRVQKVWPKVRAEDHALDVLNSLK